MKTFIESNRRKTSNSTALMTAISLSVLMTSLSTFLIVALGPNPTLLFSDDLAPGLFGLHETRDRLVVVAWWTIAALLLTFLYSASKNSLPGCITKLIEKTSIQLLLGATAMGLLVANYLLDLDRRYTDNYPRLNWIEIAVGFVILNLIFYLLLVKSLMARLLSAFFLSMLTIMTGLYVIQSPATIKDFGHFSFLSNELLAPMSDQVPLSTFVTQYTSLLGWPILPVLLLAPESVPLVTIGWLLLLQLLCIAIPIVVSARVADWRAIAPSLLILTLNIFSYAGNGLGSLASYFSGFPSRIIIPSLLYAAVVLSAGSKCDAGKRVTGGLILTGAIAGFAFLNNPDFGAAAWLAGLIALLMIPPTIGRLHITIVYLFASFSPFVGLEIVMRASGNEVNWSHLVFFQSLFGRSGYLLETMAVGGLHVAYVSFFIACILIARHLSIFDSRFSGLPIRRIARMIGFPALWGLISIPYFAGRSFTTAIMGHTYQLTLSLIGLLVFLLATRGRLTSTWVRRPITIFGAVLLIMPLVFSSAMAARIDSPQTTLEVIRRSSRDLPVLNELESSIAKVTAPHPEVTPLNSNQILILSNMVGLRTQYRSALVTSHPEYLLNHPRLLKMQCERLNILRPRYLIEMNWELHTTKSPSCRQHMSSRILDSTDGYLGVRLVQIQYLNQQ